MQAYLINSVTMIIKFTGGEMIYVCQFTGTKRKWVGSEGWVWNNGGWVRNNTSKKLIESLPYYKQQEN